MGAHSQADTQWLIPAHAGKTVSDPPSMATARAHPRSRGENMLASREVGLRAGSSPLTRGKRNYQQGPQAHERLIPAHAGKTMLSFVAWLFCPAHPRSRGENGRRDVVEATVRGSSPLTRGKRTLIPPHVMTLGLIPAHAGKTGSCGPWGRERTAHPRSRGENKSLTASSRVRIGSSPLTRGKRFHDRRCGHRNRLIPAHAGKTRT